MRKACRCFNPCVTSARSFISIVELCDENVVGAQGLAGAVVKLSAARIVVEYNFAKVEYSFIEDWRGILIPVLFKIREMERKTERFQNFIDLYNK